MAHYFRQGFSLTGDDAELVAVLKAIAVKFRPNLYDPDEEWHQYAVLSLNKFLRDTPPEGSDELRNALAALKADSTEKSAPAKIPASTAPSGQVLPTPTESSTGVTQSTPKRSITSQTDDGKAPAQTQEAPPKRVKANEEAPNFTVYTKGAYTVHVSEGATPAVEFNLNGPATVQIKTAGPSGAASSRADSVPVDNPSGPRPCGAHPGTYHQISLYDTRPAPCCASP